MLTQAIMANRQILRVGVWVRWNTHHHNGLCPTPPSLAYSWRSPLGFSCMVGWRPTAIYDHIWSLSHYRYQLLSATPTL